MSANEYVVIDGVRYAAIALVGTIDRNGDPAGNLVISQAENAFIGSNKESPGAALAMNLQLFNPVASGVNATVVLMGMEGASNPTTLISNTTELTTDETANIFRTNIDGATPLCELYSDKLAVSAAPDQIDSAIVGVGKDNEWEYLDAAIGIIVPPGYGLIMENSLVNVNCTQMIKWIEEPV